MQVAEYLQPLLEFSRENVPAKERSGSSIVLLATAGMRLLPEGEVEALLAAVRGALAGSGFHSRPEWTGMLSGQDEGLYSWLAASYGSGMLHRRLMQEESLPDNASSEQDSDDGSTEAVGIVELGGASAQVTFEHHAVGGCIMHVNGELLGTLNLPGVENALVTNSFLGFGLDVAKEQVAQLVKQVAASAQFGGALSGKSWPVGGAMADPCLPVGYSDAEAGIVGGGNFTGCLELARKVMKGDCQAHTCTISGMHDSSATHSSDGVTLPRFRGKILAVENFFYTRSILSLPAEPTLAEVEEAGERYCSTPLAQLVEQYVATGVIRHEKDLLKYCFSAAYIVVFLHNGLGVGRHERRVRFTNSVTDLQGQEVSVRWALGALVMRAAERSHELVTGGSLLDHMQLQLQQLLARTATSWSGSRDSEKTRGEQQQGKRVAAEGQEGEETVSVVFTCGPDFCCTTARIP
mmetsp:Transcript_3201/g.9118  ORF Transcript_3201/g.9118 Transcript_3201/m.9118 type:complete len:464 (+) Transcript_3201:13-1404(+)